MREGRSPDQLGKPGKSTQRGMVGGKLCVILHQWGLSCAWDCATAHVHGATRIFALTVWVASQMCYTGWSGGYTAVRGSLPRRSWRAERLLVPLLRRCTPAIRGLILKDFKLFFRAPAPWSHLLLQNFISIVNLGLAGFVLAAVAVRCVFTSTSIAGRSFWIVLASPIAVRSFLREKCWMYVLPLFVLAETLVVVSHLLRKTHASLLLCAAVILLLMTGALTGLGVGLGAMSPRFEYDNVAQTAASPGGVLYLVLSLGFIRGILLLAARPL